LACHLQKDPDPDPAYYFDTDTDPDPAFQFDADPDPKHCKLQEKPSALKRKHQALK
jgi:hypothetical protein